MPAILTGRFQFCEEKTATYKYVSVDRYPVTKSIYLDKRSIDLTYPSPPEFITITITSEQS